MANLEKLKELGFDDEQAKVVEELLNANSKQVRESSQKRENLVDKSLLDETTKQLEELKNKFDNLDTDKYLINYTDKDKKIISMALNNESYKELSKEDKIKKISEDFNIQQVNGTADAGSIINEILHRETEIKANKLEDIKKFGAKTDDDVVEYAKSLKWR